MSALPPGLAAEAQTLRRDWEARNRQMMQERFFQNNLTTIIRHSRGRMGSRLGNTHLLPQRAQWSSWHRPDSISSNSYMKMRARQLLDPESLACLLILIFKEDNKLNVIRLHRLIRNLCYHRPSRDWLIKALLSIIDRCVNSKHEDCKKRASKASKSDWLKTNNGANWLNIRIEAALGCHTNVFIINRASGKRCDRSNTCGISIHPHAAPLICRNAIELLVSLSKCFPSCLLPLQVKDESVKEEVSKNKFTISPSKLKSESTDFWDMLLKLDSTSSKKGKSLAKTHNMNMGTENDKLCVTFEQSGFGQLLTMLSSPIIQRNTLLTDKLLRLLSVITTGMPELMKNTASPKDSKAKHPKYECADAPESALTLAVDILTYKSCSEDGLEDVTNLLLNLANCSLDMSNVVNFSTCKIFKHSLFGVLDTSTSADRS